MATVATRAPKRDLAPDWRDALREAVRRFAVRSWGVLLVGVSLAGAVALATHNPNDPSLSTAAGGPPTNWLGSFGAYSSDMLLLMFGLGSALLLPVVAIAGVRMIRLEPAGRIGRGLLLAATGAVLLGIALGLTSASSVSGLPAGWGGAIGLAAAHGVDAALGLIPNPQVAGPARFATLILFALAGLIVGYFALGLTEDERGWSAACSAALHGSAAPLPAAPSLPKSARIPPHLPGRDRPLPLLSRREPLRPPVVAQVASPRRRNPRWRLATATSCRRSTC